MLKKLNDECAISYQVNMNTIKRKIYQKFAVQVTSDGGGGMVSARDFVYASKKTNQGEVFIMGGRSVDFKDAPSSNKIVR